MNEPPLIWVAGTELGSTPILVQYPDDVELPEGWRRVTPDEAARIRASHDQEQS